MKKFLPLCCLLLSCVLCAAGPLKRLPSTPFPADFRAWEPRRTLDLERAAIVRIETGELAGKGLEEKVRRRLAAAWKLDFPVMDAAQARAEKRSLILVGRGSGSMVSRRLLTTLRLLPAQKKAETRVFPELFDWKTGAVFLGGATEKDVLAAADALVKEFPDPHRLAFFIRCAEFPKTPVPKKDRARWVRSFRDLFADGRAWLPRTYAVNTLRYAYIHFLRTGDESAVQAFSELLKMYEELYDTLKGIQDRPPTFTWHEAVWMIAGMEDSPAFTAEDRARAARVTRRIGSDTMDFWEMRGVTRDYDAGKVVYNTNHPIFASRTSYFCGEYLLHRYGYEPARYWMAAAANAMKGVEPHPIGPEDSPGYHHLCTTIFINYALASGNYDLSFFRKPSMQTYFDYTKAQWAQTMRTIGYGDTGPMGGGGAVESLGYAVDIFDDADAKAILAMIGKRMIHPTLKKKIEDLGIDLARDYPVSDANDGLQCFTLDDFRLKLRKAPKYAYPVLDKAYFRSGWEGDGDFLLTSGLNRAPHGHCDLNAILRYGRGRNVWLTEGHYILYPPEEHNTLSLRVDGVHVRPDGRDRGALGTLRASAMTPDKRFAVTRVTAERFGPADWTRTVVWTAKRDFWVIDELAARQSGDFLAEYRWRSLGDMTKVSPQSIRFVQLPDSTDVRKLRKNIYDPAGYAGCAAPNEFFIHGGDAELELSSQAQPNSSRASGDYQFYNFADPVVRVVLARQRAALQKGQTLRNAHFFTHTAGQTVRKLADGAWTAAGELVLTGPYSGNGIEFDGNQLFAGPRGVIGFGVKSVRIGGWSKTYDKPTDIALNEPVAIPDAGGTELAFGPCPVVKAPEFAPKRRAKHASGIAALAVGRSGFGVGGADGTFSLVRPDGTTAWQVSGPGPADVVRALTDRQGREHWAVAFNKVETEKPVCLWRLYDDRGKLVVENKSKHERITAIFPFRRDPAGDAAFAIGYSGWMVIAHDFSGKKLWQFKCYHNMLCGAAADTDGDGKDELMLGAGYYYHQMLDAKGKLLYQRSDAAWNHAIAVSDVDGDGKPEFLCGRADDAVHAASALDRGPAGKIKPLRLGGVPKYLIALSDGFAVGVENGSVVRAGCGMKVLWRTDLPAGLTGLAERDGTFFAPCRDGFVYRLDGQGKITGKTPLAAEERTRFRPGAASGPAGVAAASGDTLVILE